MSMCPTWEESGFSKVFHVFGGSLDIIFPNLVPNIGMIVYIYIYMEDS